MNIYTVTFEDFETGETYNQKYVANCMLQVINFIINSVEPNRIKEIKEENEKIIIVNN